LDTLSYFTYKDSTYIVERGSLTFQEMAIGSMSGTFEYTAFNKNDPTDKIEVKNGKFNILNQDIKNVNDKFVITRTKEMRIDVEKGQVAVEATPIEIIIDGTMIFVNYTKKTSKSISLKIEKSEKNATTMIFEVNHTQIKHFTVDLINDNQTTIWYKNANTTTFF